MTKATKTTETTEATETTDRKPQPQTVQIPDKYKRLGAKRKFDPTPLNRCNVIIEAEPGHGKSSLAASWPETALILDFDKRQNDVVGRRATYAEIPDWETYENLRDMLVTDRAGNPFKTIVFDTTDTFLRILEAKLVDDINQKRGKGSGRLISNIHEFGEGGAGYLKLADGLTNEVVKFNSVGYSLVFMCHMRVRPVKVGDSIYTERRHAMPPTCQERLMPYVNFYGRIYKNVNVKPVVEQVPLKDAHGNPRKNKDGSAKTIRKETGKTRTEQTFKLALEPTGNEDAQDFNIKHSLFGLEGQLTLPPVGGYEVLSDAYNKAAKDAAQKIEDLKKAPQVKER